jgi:hypothetical protein
MADTKMKRLRLLFARPDLESILNELMQLACVEISEPDDLPDCADYTSLCTREVIKLDNIGANRDELAMLGTQYTLLISGWVASSTVTALTTKLSNLLCAWELADPSPDEQNSIPVIQRCPRFFGKLRLRNRKPFAPLAIASKESDAAEQDAAEQDANEQDANEQDLAEQGAADENNGIGEEQQ